MGELKIKTVSGIKWLVGSSFLQKGISVATTVVLARILTPSVFGLCALAFVAVDAFSLFKSMGFDSALIKRNDNIEKAANTAFFTIPMLGILLYLLLSFSAPLIGRFLNNLEVISVIRALGMIFLISCFGTVPRVLLEKNLEFKKLSIIEISGRITFSIIAIFFAILGFQVWSLVVAFIIKTLYENIALWFLVKWRPCLSFDKKLFWEMFHFGKFIFLGSIIWFLKMNLDNLLVSKLLGIATLGLYATAFNVANFMSDYIGGKVFRVTYPAYSKLQSDRVALREAYLKVFKHMSLITLPFGIGLSLLSGECISFIYGDKWIAATNVLRILAWAGIFNALPSSLGNIFLACGKPKWGFYIVTLQVVIFCIFITPIAKLFGINGVGIVVASSSLIAFIIMLWLVMRILEITLLQVYESMKTALFSSLFMAITIILFKYIFLQNYFSRIHKIDFMILSPIALVVYLFFFYKIDKSAFKHMKLLIYK